MSESTKPAQCRDEDWNLARDCGLQSATPGTNAWDAALGRFADTLRAAPPAPVSRADQFALSGDEVRAIVRSQYGSSNAPQGSDYIAATVEYLNRRAASSARAPVSRAEPVAYVGYGGEGKPKTLLLKADLPVGTTLYANPVAQRADTDEDSPECPECHGKGSVDVTHEPLRDGYTETYGQCCDNCQGTGKIDAQSAPLNEGGSEPVASVRPSASPAAMTVIREKLARFEECAGDDEDCDIGREWFDALTTIGLLSRTQRSPARWSLTPAGEALLAASPAGRDARHIPGLVAMSDKRGIVSLVFESEHASQRFMRTYHCTATAMSASKEGV
ncbi:hypothetical protein RA280_14745 [Cupriavidus sp. CV2]|uniref:hypothetical protein n=1 Tax=Cupriavidus ulmosensis TaxID=3065913 RepID=UPI00296ADB6F|nr:hypothetical protein [Cupriavidus sp. CV2]MDW3682983.1 hypothetical protein [Cupriavidus sp. CV2]